MEKSPTLPKALQGFEVEDCFTAIEEGYRGFVFYLLLSAKTTPRILSDNLGHELKVRPAIGKTTVGIRYTNQEGIKIQITLGFGSESRETVESAVFLKQSSRCKALVSFRYPTS